jgi:Zn-dependent peptidase ImmA (M78 family)
MNDLAEQYEIINHFRRTAPVDVDGLVRGLGLRKELAFLLPSISGTIEKRDSSFLITVNAGDPITRQRFTTAHELGHYMLHRDRIGDGIADDRAYRSTFSGKYHNTRIGPREETQANAFAANVLMPYELIQELKSQGTSTPELLAKKLLVSEQAMCIRLGVPYKPD